MKYPKISQYWKRVIYTAIVIAIVLILSGIQPSEASGDDKTIIEGYDGSERIKLVEKPVSGNSEVISTKGWMGFKRVDLRTTTTSTTESTCVITRGWVDGEYVRITTESKANNDE